MLVAILCSAFTGTVWGETVTWAGTTALPGEATTIGSSPIKIKTSSTNTYTSPIRVYANTTITISATTGYVINSVTYEASSTGNYVTYAQNATVSPTVTPTVSGKNVTWSFTDGTSEFTFKPSSQTRANSITVEYSSTGGSQTETCATPTFSPAAGTYTSAQNVTISTETSGATIYYTIDGTDPTANSSVYSSAIPVSTTTTIKAMAVASGYDNSSIASATYAILGHAGTAADPFTVADAIAFIGTLGSTTSTDDVYVSGIISQVDSYNDTYSSITYWISDDGTTSNQLEVYSGKGLDGAGFSSIDDLKVGDIVTVKGKVKMYNSTPEFDKNNEIVSIQSTPTISVSPSSLTGFTYVEGSGPSTAKTVSVSGTDLTANLSLSLGDNSNFEISFTEGSDYTNSLTLNQANGTIAATTIYVRLKAGLAKADNYSGTITLTSTGATTETVTLSGSVTGQTYAISVENSITGGTIEADLASAAAGVTVTLTATPDAAYTFGSWSVYEDDLTTLVPVTNNQFTMPACEVYVTATFNAKPTYVVTCVADPVAGGTVAADPSSAYEGQTVTLTCTTETGYTLSTVVITKTSDGSATEITPIGSNGSYTFTMPAYAVTATATFISDNFDGSFLLFEDEIVEGDYILVYDGGAMTNTVSSNKFTITSVAPSDDVISNPSRNIVWHIAPASTEGYWTIYNAKVEKYANSSSGTSTNVSLVDKVLGYGPLWVASGTTTHDFRCKNNEEQSTVRYLRRNGTSGFGSYASTNGGPLTLYKYTVMTERTITFNGNGGTYNNESTYTQTVNDGIATALMANQFTHANSSMAFAGWSTTQNGSVEYADGASVTLNGDLTLYAQWNQSYTATVDDQIVNGTVKIVTAGGNEDEVLVAEGTEITLTYTASTGYIFDAWNVYKVGDQSTTVAVTNNKFMMPAYDVIISATFVAVPTYSLATSITSGRHYIITNGTDKAMGTQNTNNRAAVDITIENGIATVNSADVKEFVIQGPDADGYYTIYDGTGYLYAVGGTSNNHLKTEDSPAAHGHWTIEFGDGNKASIVANISGRNTMRYNSGSSVFSCYASGQDDVYLYEKSGEDTPTEAVTLNASGYATYCSKNALDFTNSGVSAWAITAVNGENITFSQITKVPAGTGMLLKGSASQNASLTSLTGAADVISTNLLEGFTTATEVSANKYYGLSGNQFKKVNAGTIPAGKALLPATEVGSAARLTFVFEDDNTTTDISEKGIVNSEKFATAPAYNLNGQRVNDMKKGGLYIMNGKKVIVK